jgi:hypothetical protein
LNFLERQYEPLLASVSQVISSIESSRFSVQTKNPMNLKIVFNPSPYPAGKDIYLFAFFPVRHSKCAICFLPAFPFQERVNGIANCSRDAATAITAWEFRSRETIEEEVVVAVVVLSVVGAARLWRVMTLIVDGAPILSLLVVVVFLEVDPLKYSSSMDDTLFV